MHLIFDEPFRRELLAEGTGKQWTVKIHLLAAATEPRSMLRRYGHDRPTHSISTKRPWDLRRAQLRGDDQSDRLPERRNRASDLFLSETGGGR
jgi:hypothetical protein